MQPTINCEEEIVLTSISDDNRENKNDAHFAQHGAKKMDLRPAEQLPALYICTQQQCSLVRRSWIQLVPTTIA
jgi:hypothetical protein